MHAAEEIVVSTKKEKRQLTYQEHIVDRFSKLLPSPKEYLIISSHNASWRAFDEIKDEVAFGALWQGGLNLLDRLADVQAREVHQAIGVLDSCNLLLGERTAVQSNGVDTAIRDRFAGSNDVWRNVLIDL